MRKRLLLLVLSVLMLGLTGCGSNALDGECECTVAVQDVPKELEMLDDNLLEIFRIEVELENIYSEKSVDVELTAENGFKEELKLQPGTYLVKNCYASAGNLVPIEVEAKQEKIELTRNNPLTIDVAITNVVSFADWAWNSEPSREILEEDAFSHRVQFEGKIIDVTEIAKYVDFIREGQVEPYEKVTIGNGERGITITVQNQSETAASWQDCKLVEVTFKKNNVVWGQGAFVGMEVKKAVHAKEGLYGEPYKMSGTVLAGVGYDSTMVSYLDENSGDKLTLKIVPGGDYISEITYAFAVYE